MTGVEPTSRMSKEVGDEYSSSLADLTMNSKPLINMLTILAEENIEHAAVIVQSVEKHLDKVRSDIKLPVLYLVDSIIKNVGGSYTQLFAHIIVNMFCKVFKQVDERTRFQMFKLRETWHDVFPSAKLYQLDVKVNLVDPAWPIQARPSQSNIHVNPNFLKSVSSTTAPVVNSISTAPAITTTLIPEEVKMREMLAQKEQELMRLQKIEIELAQKEKEVMEKRKALEKNETQQVLLNTSSLVSGLSNKLKNTSGATGNQVSTPRIAPVNPALVNIVRNRDPRLVNTQPPVAITQPTVPQEAHTITAVSRRADPRLSRKAEVVSQDTTPSVKNDKSPTKNSHRHSEKKKDKSREIENSKVVKDISKLPPIPKIKSNDKHSATSTSPNSPTKRKKENESPKSHRKHKKVKDSSPKEEITDVKVLKKSASNDVKKHKTKKHVVEEEKEDARLETFKELKRRSKERNYIRRNRDKSPTPEEDLDLRKPEKTIATTVPDILPNGAVSSDVDLRTLPPPVNVTSQAQRKRTSSEGRDHEPVKKSKPGKLDELFGNEDVDLRKLPISEESVNTNHTREKTKSPTPVVSKVKGGEKKVDIESENDEDDETEEQSSLGNIRDVEGGWAKVKEIQSPQVVPNQPSLSNLDMVRAKLAKATKKDGLGRLRIFSEDGKEKKRSKDTDMRLKSKSDLGGESLDNNIKIIMSQAEEQLQSGNINKDQYNVLLMQVLQLNERQKLKEAKQKESLEASKRKLQWLQKKKSENKEDDIREGSSSPESERSTDSPIPPMTNSMCTFGDIDERVPPTMILPNAPLIPDDSKQRDSDMRMLSRIPDKNVPHMEPNPMHMMPEPDMHPMADPSMHPMADLSMHPMADPNMHPMADPNMPHGPNMFMPGAPWVGGPRGFPSRGFRGPRPRGEEWGGPRGFRGRGAGRNWRMPVGNRPMMEVPERLPHPGKPFIPVPVEPRVGSVLGPNPIPPYVNDGRGSPPPLGFSSGKEYIRLDPNVLEYMQRDTMKSISIDGVNREIRFYDTTAVVLLDWDDPREIFFQPGQRKVSIDDQTISLCFGEDYVPIIIDGVPHQIKFGSPTRELFIDDAWFECYFGGPPVPILIDGKLRLLKLDGPPPQVTIGDIRRNDLCVGKINVIIDGYTTVPVFLDAKPQLIRIGGVPHSLRFVDALETVLINNKAYKVEYGGLPKPYIVNKKKHFIRFTVLPRSVRAGEVNIVNMEGKRPTVIPPTSVHQDKQPLGLDILASILPSTVAPAQQIGSYSAYPTSNVGPDVSEPPPQIPPVQSIDVNSLLAKLVASGILPSVENKETKKTEEEVKNVEEKPKIEEPVLEKPAAIVLPVDLHKSETLKVKQPGLVSLLHSGMQCGSCGARFPPEHTTRYSQHLDWHFRQNRAERDSQRRPHSRRWYYDISDWVQFEEIEDLEEREKSWFERQQEEGATAEASESLPCAQEEVSVIAPPPTAPLNQFKCGHCGDPFHQFYNQESEEWQLRRAVTFENNNYHPDCLEEYKISMAEKSALETSGVDEPSVSEKKEPIIEFDDDEWKDDEEPEVQIKETPEEEEKEEEMVEEEEEDESVVEVISEKSQEVEEVELLDDEPEDDDVVIKTEPVVEITVDECDTDEETEKERAARDEQYQIDFSKVKIKQEPIDPDEEQMIKTDDIIVGHADTTRAAVISSIDGNVQLQPATVPASTGPSKIRINITKTLAPPTSTPPPKPTAGESAQPPEQESDEFPDAPSYKVKQSLEGVEFTVQPPTQRGNELSGLCSIM